MVGLVNEFILTQELIDKYLPKKVVSRYESIRRSGVFNMIMDMNQVISILWPDEDPRDMYKYYSALQQRYSDLLLMYNITDDTVLPEFKYESKIVYSFE